MNNKNYLHITNKNTKKSNRFLRIGDVIKMTSISKSYIYQLCKDNLFPRSVNLIPGGTSVAWIESEILDWIDERIQARNDGGSING